MKVAIVGSRQFVDRALMERAVDKLVATHGEHLVIVSGGATGADQEAERAAQLTGVPVRIFKPDWDKFGRSAGFKRNVEIVDEADMLVAFFAEGLRTKGTQHSIDLALKKGIPVHVWFGGKWFRK